MTRKAVESTLETCVVIPYFEDPDGLLSALKSLSIDDVDVVVVDDGSVECPAVVHEGVVLITLAENQGIAAALNVGFQYALRHNYEFVGRLDCGDVASRDRFAKQTTVLRQNSKIDVVGSWVRFVDDNNNFLYDLKQPTNAADVLRGMAFGPTLTHPAVTIRSAALDPSRLYRLDRPSAEDFDFLWRLVKNGAGVNLPEVLTVCSIRVAGISTKRRREQNFSKFVIMLDHFDASLPALLGIAKTLILMLTPRSFSTFLRRIARRGRN